MEPSKMIYIRVENIKPTLDASKEESLKKIREITGHPDFRKKKEEVLQLIVISILKEAPIAKHIVVEDVFCRVEREALRGYLQDVYIHYAKKTEKEVLHLLNSPEGKTEQIFNAVVKCIQEEMDIRAKTYTDLVNGRIGRKDGLNFDTVDVFNYYLQKRKTSRVDQAKVEYLYTQMQAWRAGSKVDLSASPENSKNDIYYMMDEYVFLKVVSHCQSVMETRAYAPEDVEANALCSFVVDLYNHWGEIKKAQLCRDPAIYDEVLGLFSRAFDWKYDRAYQKECREKIREKVLEEVAYLSRKASLSGNFKKERTKENANASLCILLDVQTNSGEKNTQSSFSENFVRFLSLMKSILFLVFSVHSMFFDIKYALEEGEPGNLSFLSLWFANLVITPIFTLLSISKELYGDNIGSKKGRERPKSALFIYPEDFAYLVGFFIFMSFTLCFLCTPAMQRQCVYIIKFILFFFNLAYGLRNLSKSFTKLRRRKDNRLRHIVSFLYHTGSLVVLLAGMYFFFLRAPWVGDDKVLNVLVRV
ncbi:hypothetical protein NEMIN01_0557 [Nematocida minor]|uniref:uncharacterized protein n=1 Tax=Nematocida minor TaxID=1912983 RepID=UPI0022203673|nr:uncharacterized protein NEMIN01_0557 [Nematocida minor]KAI5189494.1 hypothetical protein NEMIN01_0557 [Nematocida minor]